MTYIIGTMNKVTGAFLMYAPTFPYNRITYIGYTLEGMKKKYREDFNLKGKHIEWIIL